jgi:hypothetical protein
MRQCGPSRINKTVLPLRNDVQPRVQMKFNVVSGRCTKEKKGDFDGEGR